MDHIAFYWLCVAIVAVGNLLIGVLATAYFYERRLRRVKGEADAELEKQSYLAGFRDSIFYVADTESSDLYVPKIAELRFKEYVALKRGPQRH